MTDEPEYEWDDAKAAANATKHGVPFTAAYEFEWDKALVIPDTRRDYGEPRWLAYAPIGKRLHAMIFTIRAGRIRVISLRKANSRELARYERESRS